MVTPRRYGQDASVPTETSTAPGTGPEPSAGPWAAGSAFPSAETGHGGDLRHPGGELAGVEVLEGSDLDASRRPAHPDGCDRWYGPEVHAFDEHDLDMAREAAAAEAPPVPDAVVGHSPLHGPLQAGEGLGRQGVDRFGDAALRLREAAEVGEDRFVADGGLCGTRPAGHP